MTMPIRKAVRLPIGLAAVSLLLSGGCGVSSPSPTDPGEAQATLAVVLDAWKAGGRPEDLAGRSPAIHVNDKDWHNGLKLVAYKTSGEGKANGFDMNYPVVLELTSPKGKSVKKTAVYTITTKPQLLVLRQEG